MKDSPNNQVKQLSKPIRVSGKPFEIFESPMFKMMEKQTAMARKWYDLSNSLSACSTAIEKMSSSSHSAILKATNFPMIEAIERQNAVIRAFQDSLITNREIFNPTLMKDIYLIHESMSKYQLPSNFHNLLEKPELVKFSVISNQILNDWLDYDLPEEVLSEVSATLKESKSNTFNLERIIAIISLIIAIFAFIHEMLPDKAVEETNHKLQQLIDIQKRQLEIMEQQSQTSQSEPFSE